MSTKSSNPVLGPETIASLRRKSEQARKANEAARLRTGRSTPQQLKALAAKAKAADKALKKAENKARQKKNLERDEASLRLTKGRAGKAYGSMDGSESDLKPKPKATPKPARKSKVLPIPPATQEDTSDDYDTKTMTKRPKLSTVKVPIKPKTIETPNVDKLKSVKRPTKTSQEAKERSSVKTAKKKRDRLFGLKSMPKIDSKEGGDKVNLPFGLGSYETLPQEEETSMNKKGGRIKYKSGGKIRKAGCKRGMGKAMRGY